MSKLYAIRQTKFDKYWYDFVEDFTSPILDFHCVSNNLDYVEESQQSLMKCNPAWKDSEIVELGIISDLEAKLADTEFRYGNLHNLYYKDTEELKQQLVQSRENLTQCEADRKFEQEKKDIATKRVSELKQQLAEKDKEIEDLKAQRRIYLNRSVEECNKITDLEFELQHEQQDKISFALEQLEKVKELLKYEIRNASCLLELGEYNCYVAGYENSIEAIDNQIKQLKEMK